MLRGFYITAIVLSVVAIITCAAFMDEVESYRYSSYDYSYDSQQSNDDYNYYQEQKEQYTEMAGGVTLAYFLIMTTIFILSLIRLKTTTIKVFSIIGLSLSGIIILWDAVMMASPGSVSFDEVGGAWIFYALIMVAFSIVGTVHAFRKKV